MCVWVHRRYHQGEDMDNFSPRFLTKRSEAMTIGPFLPLFATSLTRFSHSRHHRPKCQFSKRAPLLRPDGELLVSKSLASACPLGDRRPLCYDRRGQPQSLFFSERAGCRKGPDTGISSRGHRVQVSSVQRCTFQQGRNCFTWWRGPRI